MPGALHRLLGKEDHPKRVGLTQEMSEKLHLSPLGPSLWGRGDPEPWYLASELKRLSKIPPHKLILKAWWKRSLLSHLGIELLIYVALYYIIHLIYRFGLSSESQKSFEALVYYLDTKLGGVGKDLAFLLGFYVKQTVSRWWDQVQTLPWPDKLPLLTHALVDASNPSAVAFKNKLLRYSMLAYILCIRRFSTALTKMFPSDQTLRDTRLATEKELSIIKSEGAADMGRVWWIPLSWAMHMIKGSKADKIIASEQKILMGGLAEFQCKLEKVESFDFCIFPPVYRQVVRFALFSYFLLSLLGSQQVLSSPEPLPFFPLFLLLKFIFVFGWLEVAEAIENPWGCDEDDVKICQLVSRHVWALGTSMEKGEAMEGKDEDGDEDESRA